MDDGLASLRGGDEPARKGHGLKAGGPGGLVVIEEEGLHGLGLIVQTQYLLLLEPDRKLQKEKQGCMSSSRLLVHNQ